VPAAAVAFFGSACFLLASMAMPVNRMSDRSDSERVGLGSKGLGLAVKNGRRKTRSRQAVSTRLQIDAAAIAHTVNGDGDGVGRGRTHLVTPPAGHSPGTSATRHKKAGRPHRYR